MKTDQKDRDFSSKLYPQSVNMISGIKPPLQFTTSPRRIMLTGLIIFGIALIAGGIAWYYYSSNQKASFERKLLNGLKNNDTETASVGGVTKVKMIKVDVEGAIERTGIVEIPYDSRIQDVLITAGGLDPKADRTYVSKSINLAQRVIDGQKIYIPFQGEVESGFMTKIQNNQVGQANIVSINSGSAEELDALPGIGAVTSNKIMSGRPYQNLTDLIDRKIISTSVFNKIKDKISL